MKLSWFKRGTKANVLAAPRPVQGAANFKTTLRYPVERVITWTRAELEEQIAMACMFNMAEVEWFTYSPLRLDEKEVLVFEVEGRNYIPLPENGTPDEIKAALL
jgi:hypothetical protein